MNRKFDILAKTYQFQKQDQMQNTPLTVIHKKKLKIQMLAVLNEMHRQKRIDSPTFGCLEATLKNIPQSEYIQTIISTQKLKLHAQNDRSISHLFTQKIRQQQAKSQKKRFYRSTSTSEKALQTEIKSNKKGNIQEMKIQDQYLISQALKPSHPYQKIICAFIEIKKNKYFQFIQQRIVTNKQLDISNLFDLLQNDFLTIKQYLQSCSTTILEIFSMKNKKGCQKRLQNLVLQILRKSLIIQQIFSQVLCSGAKCSTQIKSIINRIPRLTEIECFNLPRQFEIEGCYFQTMSNLIQLSQNFEPQKLLLLLSNIRKSICLDIDNYYQKKSQKIKISVTSDHQMEILKYILSKLKIFLGNIFGRLKYMEIMFRQQIAYEYGSASYMLTQLFAVIEILKKQL